MAENWIEERVCILVKTYPVPAKNGIEVSCTAGITESGQWIRLFPVPFRLLDQDKRFKRYQWIKLRVTKSKDARPESFKIDPDSISLLTPEPIATDKKWEKRKEIISPLQAISYCSLKEKRDTDGYPTLGFFKPKAIRRLVIEKLDDTWSDEELAKLRQVDMFESGPAEELEKIPYKFSYEFFCNEESCPGHTFMCSDWEMGQAFRAWKQKYGADWEKYFRQKFEGEMIEKNDTHFYVGTVHQHPANWIIVGLFYPRK